MSLELLDLADDNDLLSADNDFDLSDFFAMATHSTSLECQGYSDIVDLSSSFMSELDDDIFLCPSLKFAFDCGLINWPGVNYLELLEDAASDTGSHTGTDSSTSEDSLGT